MKYRRTNLQIQKEVLASLGNKKQTTTNNLARICKLDRRTAKSFLEVLEKSGAVVSEKINRYIDGRVLTYWQLQSEA